MQFGGPTLTHPSRTADMDQNDICELTVPCMIAGCQIRPYYETLLPDGHMEIHMEIVR